MTEEQIGWTVYFSGVLAGLIYIGIQRKKGEAPRVAFIYPFMFSWLLFLLEWIWAIVVADEKDGFGSDF